MYKQWQYLIQSRWLYVMALVLGLMQALVFDFVFDSPLKWLVLILNFISLAGFLWLLKDLTPRRAAIFGYVFGLGVFGWGLNWVYISMAQFGGAPLSFALLANAAVVAYLALYWLVAAYLIVKWGKTPNQCLLLAPAVIALLEWVRSVFLIGFPWLSIGYGLIDTNFARIFAPIGGVFFVGFVYIMQCVVVLLLLNVWCQPAKAFAKKALVICLIFLLCKNFIFPFAQLVSSSNESKDRTTNITLIQGNMPVITEYNHARMSKNLDKYTALTDAVLENHSPNVVIWPEAAIPFFYIEAGDFLANVWEQQFTHGFDLITGVPHIDFKSNDIYNAIVLQKYGNDPNAQFYYKQHLLPFGEYLPFRPVFAFFKDFVDIPMSDFSRGQVVQPPFLAGGLTFSPSICFEAVFGDEIRQNARAADILLNISNDAWFGKSKAQAQHLNIARMRAIENQKMLVRATNDGLTAIVDRQGKILQALPPFKEGTLTATVTGYSATTLYVKYGDTPIIILCLVMIAVITKIGLFLRFKVAGEKV
ncbi:MAG: apolipoprotein N-acyltransferase [Gammaproteobacteria bacterium]|nr:MAG: apolipoprotein N-acyltransferase [Gammaproteobacteria bacterium]